MIDGRGLPSAAGSIRTITNFRKAFSFIRYKCGLKKVVAAFTPDAVSWTPGYLKMQI
jgi:hypothetical protein